MHRPLSRPLSSPVARAVGEGVISSLAAPFNLAASRPIDVVMMGDSNQLRSGHGFDHGLGLALSERVGLYASPVYSQQITGNDYNSQGVGSAGALGIANSASTGLPAEFADYLLPTNFPYAYQAASGMGSNNGIFVNCVSKPDVYGVNSGHTLRAHLCYGTFPTGSGSIKPAWRDEGAGTPNLVLGSAVSSNAGAYGSAVTTLDLPAGTRTADVSARYTPGFPNNSTAPTVEFWSRVEVTSRTTGAAVSTLYGESSQSLYDMASYLQTQTDAALTNYFKAVRHIQVQRGLDPVVVIYINSGINDRNETSTPSLGPSPNADPDSPEAYTDNLDAVVNRIKAIWTLNGWTQANLYFCIVPAHRIADPDDAELLTYRSAAVAWAVGKTNTRVVDLGARMTAAEATAGGWYDGGGAIHLVQAGYEAVGRKIIATP